MSNKRKIMNVETKCRLCLGDEGCMSYLFDETLKKKLDNITKCTSIVIKENEALPDKICHVCLYKLDSWDEFKEQFVKSNEMLLTHLVQDPANADNLLVIDTESNDPKRQHNDSQACRTENLSDSVTQKKVENAADQPTVEHMRIVEDEAFILNLKKELGIPETDEPVIVKDEGTKDNEEESKSKEMEEQIKLPSSSVRGRWFWGKRGKTTAKRKASTRRWVARKKALLAATGENASDTDSIISDNESKLSPVQKARAKTNADKEVEKQKRLAKALKNLETDMKGEYGIKYDNDIIVIRDTDSEGKAHKTRSQKKFTLEKASVDETKNSINSTRSETGKKNKDEEAANDKKDNNVSRESLLKKQVTNLQDEMRESDDGSLIDKKIVLNPQPVKSKLEVGDATYIVTSTLVLSEPHHLEETNTKDSSKDESGLNMDENSQERNTDIIDAVQLRRIIPKSTDDNDEKKNIERCLNIEVEGTELEALQRVQSELAAFVEKDMRDRLYNGELLPGDKNPQSKQRDSFQTLDQQLKTIVEKAIKKNIEMSKLRKNSSSNAYNVHNKKTSTFSAAFVKAAMKSKLFQPRVELRRLNLTKASKRYKINNITVTQYEKTGEKEIENQNRIFSEIKQTNSSLPYHTFKLMPMETDNIVSSDDQIVTSTPRAYKRRAEIKSEIPRTNDLSLKKSSPPKGTKKLSMSQQVLRAIRKEFSENVNLKRVEKPICETVECDTTTKTLPPQPSVGDKPATKRVKFSRNYETESIDLEDPNQRKHFCGICKETFATLDEMEVHIKSHKPASVSEVLPKSKKPRMMRCKRCHEVVDAKLVRAHTCRSAKYHKCYVCNSTFRSEKMLVSHLETHDGSEFNIENIELGETTKKSTNVSSTRETIAQHAADSNTTNNELAEKQVVILKESYTCFVCDKKFTDDEVLKDHLQQHCNDVSEEDACSGKEEQYQCAICGDTLESEDALEMHVEKHLCDDQDDNPNLINISNDSDQNKEIEDIFRCSQCTKEFNSEMLLAMHMQAHEEEAAIAVWEKESAEGMKTEEEFFCAICEETFQTEEEISKHLDAHNGNAHVCFLCEKPFLSLADLQLHVESH